MSMRVFVIHAVLIGTGEFVSLLIKSKFFDLSWDGGRALGLHTG